MEPKASRRGRHPGCGCGFDLGFFSDRRGGRFCINAVTGPDEYSTVVHNNTYTNLMGKSTYGTRLQ